MGRLAIECRLLSRIRTNICSYSDVRYYDSHVLIICICAELCAEAEFCAEAELRSLQLGLSNYTFHIET